MILKPNKIELKNFSDSKKFNETKFGLPAILNFVLNVQLVINDLYRRKSLLIILIQKKNCKI